MKKFLICLIFFLLYISLPASADVVYDAHTHAELISENKSIRAGRPFWTALRLKTDPHWHTYWQNPGDSGLPTTIKWQLPEGFSATAIAWPYPQRLDAAGLTVYGYEDETFLLTQIHPPEKIDAPNISLKARVDWLACEVPCIPGKADFVLNLPVVSEEAVIDPEKQDIFAQAFSRLPVKAHEWKIEAREDETNIYIKFFPPDSMQKIQRMEFFPLDSELIEHSSAQSFAQELLTVQKNKRTVHKSERLKGVAIVYGDDKSVLKALEVDVPLKSQTPSQSIGLMLFFSFLGGMILNLMPCVFPVLSLKILTFVNHSQNKQTLFKSALSYTGGIVMSFAALALILIFLREGGEQIGWGFQFQSPYFVIGMVFFLFIIALNLFGLFEWNIPLLFTQKPGVQGIREAFLSGILAVIVATPCTAPFMGTAMSFALTQAKLVNLLIFIFLGLGMAFPFVLLCLSPRLLKLLPKPGPWMENFKKFLAYPVWATVIWLLWVLAGQQDSFTVTAVLFGLLLMKLGIWIITVSRLRVLRIAGFICMIVSVLWPLSTVRSDISLQPSQERSPRGIQWLDFEESLIQQIPDGKVVFVDFTARWCLTCQVNERLALAHPDVVAKFKELDVQPIKADWTNHDESISRTLADFGKNSVPVYVILYSANGKRQAEILPELLTPQLVIEALEKVNRIKAPPLAGQGGQP